MENMGPHIDISGNFWIFFPLFIRAVCLWISMGRRICKLWLFEVFLYVYLFKFILRKINLTWKKRKSQLKIITKFRRHRMWGIFSDYFMKLDDSSNTVKYFLFCFFFFLKRVFKTSFAKDYKIFYWNSSKKFTTFRF